MSSIGKIFYIGFQRVGTKSFGLFMELNGFEVASWDVSSQNDWSAKFFNGMYGDILRSQSFARYQVFEDGPWYHPGLVKYLYHELPDARFVLLTRPAQDWFRSMVAHSSGLTLGDAEFHCEAYDRLEDHDFVARHLPAGRKARMSIFDKPQHYMAVYRKKTLELQAFFRRMPDSEKRVFMGGLYDPEVYPAIARFLGIENPLLPPRAVHKSDRSTEECLSGISELLESYLTTPGVKMGHNNEATRSELDALLGMLPQAARRQAILHKMGILYLRLGELDEAERTAREGLDMDPGCPRLHYLLGRVLLRQGRILEAAGALEQAVRLVDDNPEFRRLLARLRQRAANEARRAQGG